MRSLLVVTAALIMSCAQQNVEETTTLGTISFTPTGQEDALPHFEKGLLLLHSFEYEDARTSFTKAREIDSDFYMTYWGEAMTYNHPLWSSQYTDEGRATLESLAPTADERLEMAPTELEGDLMTGVNILFAEEGDKPDRDKLYSEHMLKLYKKYPDNHEIAAFYALSILGSSSEREATTYEKGAIVAKSILEENPDHPGALHYLIHSYDDPDHAAQALQAANSYSKVAPDAGHALHMPSHIYVAMGMWDEVISSNIASWEASDARRERLDLDNNAKNYHALQWLMYGYLQRGETDEAKQLLNDMVQYHDELPSSRARAYYTMMRAGYLVDSEEWTSPIATAEIQDTDLNVSVRAINAFVSGRVAFAQGNLDGIEAVIAEMEEMGAAETKRMMQRGAAMCSGVNWTRQLPTPTDVAIAEVMELELKALHAMMLGKNSEADKWLTQACELEDNTAFMFGPPSVVKPAHEMYAEWLIENNQIEAAQFHIAKALEKTPGRKVVVELNEATSTASPSI